MKKMITFDTSALVRFFTNDIPKKAQRVKEIIESKERIIIPDVVFPELEYVLFGKSYTATREKIIKAFEFLAFRKNITISKEALKAIEIYKTTKLDMADCIILATSPENKLFSFDKKLHSARKVKVFK